MANDPPWEMGEFRSFVLTPELCRWYPKPLEIHNGWFAICSPVHLRDVGHAPCDAHWRDGAKTPGMGCFGTTCGGITGQRGYEKNDSEDLDLRPYRFSF